MTSSRALDHDRASFARKAWAESYRLLQAAERESPLEPEDFERLAIAAYLTERDDESERSMARAHQMFLDRGECEGAARAAFWLGFALLGRGAMAPAAGWLARAERVLDERQLDCVVRGYLLIPAAIQRIVHGEAAAGYMPDFSWVDLPLRTRHGLPIQDRGIVESIPGLYFIGLPFLYSLSSALLGGVGRDAAHIVDHIASKRPPSTTNPPPGRSAWPVPSSPARQGRTDQGS